MLESAAESGVLRGLLGLEALLLVAILLIDSALSFILLFLLEELLLLLEEKLVLGRAGLIVGIADRPMVNAGLVGGRAGLVMGSFIDAFCSRKLTGKFVGRVAGIVAPVERTAPAPVTLPGSLVVTLFAVSTESLSSNPVRHLPFVICK